MIKPVCKYIIDIHSIIITNHFIDDELFGFTSNTNINMVDDYIVTDTKFDGCNLVYRVFWFDKTIILITYE